MSLFGIAKGWQSPKWRAVGTVQSGWTYGEEEGRVTFYYLPLYIYFFFGGGFPGGLGSEESACNTGDLCLIPGSERSPGEGNGYPLQYSCLENSMDKGAG